LQNIVFVWILIASSVAKFIVHDWGDKVDSVIGLLYRPARLHRLKGQYKNPLLESTTSPQSGTKILASGLCGENEGPETLLYCIKKAEGPRFLKRQDEGTYVQKLRRPEHKRTGPDKERTRPERSRNSECKTTKERVQLMNYRDQAFRRFMIWLGPIHTYPLPSPLSRQ
jgi:hypothetical protein